MTHRLGLREWSAASVDDSDILRFLALYLNSCLQILDKMPIATPHLVPLPSPLCDIVLEFQVHADAKRFTISLCMGNDLSQVVPFAFDTRFNDGAVVRNHHQNGWGPEERHGGNPFKKGEHCEVRLIVKNDLYQVFVNKQHFCDFKPRLGNETIRNLFIQGDITILNISFPGSGSSGHHPAGHSLQDPPVPLTVPIASISGRKIVIAGVPTANTRFSVNLQCGSGDRPDIALHFDVRFCYGNCNNKVIINTRSGGNWSSEVAEHHSFPFAVNQPFEIVIKPKGDSFKITVDDEKFDNFPCRIKADQVTHLNITGDVRLNKVKV